MFDYPACPRCGQPARFVNEQRCEDCFAEDAQRWHGNAQSVNLFSGRLSRSTAPLTSAASEPDEEPHPYPTQRQRAA